MRHYTTTEHERGQRTAAGIVLEHPEQYGAGLVTWARLVLGTVTEQEPTAQVAQSPTRTGEQMALGFDGHKAHGINSLGP